MVTTLISSFHRRKQSSYRKKKKAKVDFFFLSGDLSPGRSCITLADEDPVLLHNVPHADEAPPIHLLEACHRMLIAEEKWRTTRTPKQQRSTLFGFKFTKKDCDIINPTCHSSVMDLKAKGIQFRASSSYSIRDVKFNSGFFSGQLQLPARTYEMSPDADTEFEMLSCANFMKSLIESPEDVKELQEKGVFDEQVVEEFKGIDTFGLDNLDIFKDVKWEIEEHCRSKAKTWTADLIHTRSVHPAS
ncbi:hypothetical protein Pfo_010440 [Paulownia fortunei]|nr:hypothetical protein Pfo_010440 [Paulownia fortunei]